MLLIYLYMCILFKIFIIFNYFYINYLDIILSILFLFYYNFYNNLSPTVNTSCLIKSGIILHAIIVLTTWFLLNTKFPLLSNYIPSSNNSLWFCYICFFNKSTDGKLRKHVYNGHIKFVLLFTTFFILRFILSKLYILSSNGLFS